MSFFGLTFFGPPSPFVPFLAGVQNLNNYSDEIFETCFNSLKDEQGTIDVAELRILLSRVFQAEPNAADLKALQRLLEAGDVTELQAKPSLDSTAHLTSSSVTTLTLSAIEANKVKKETNESKSFTSPSSSSLSSPKRISWEEFYSALRTARAQRASSGSHGSCEFSSSNEFRQKLKSHKRFQLDPQDKYTTPITSAQEYGWFNQTSVERSARKPHISCEETKYASSLVRSGIFY
jgi:hypothetical protein